MIKHRYENYEKAHELLNMKTLYDRRQALSFNFAKRCLKTDKVKHFFFHLIRIIQKEQEIMKFLKWILGQLKDTLVQVFQHYKGF